MGSAEFLHDATPSLPELGKEDVGLNNDNYPSGFLLGAFSLIGAVLTLLGVSGGTVGRMIRNESTLTIIGFLTAGVAVVLGVIADSEETREMAGKRSGDRRPSRPGRARGDYLRRGRSVERLDLRRTSVSRSPRPAAVTCYGWR